MPIRACAVVVLGMLASCGGGTEPHPRAPGADAKREAQEENPVATATTARAAPRRLPEAALEPAEPQPDPGPSADLSKQLGGMRFGMSVKEFVEACAAAGGQLMPRDPEAIDLFCTVIPIPLMTSGRVAVPLTGQVGARFCGEGATVCEIMYGVNGAPQYRDDQLAALLDLLTQKYGPPVTREGYEGNDPMRKCRLGQSVHVKRGWFFTPKQTPPHPFGWARVVFDCDGKGASVESYLTVFYDDEHGLRQRSAESNERRQNF